MRRDHRWLYRINSPPIKQENSELSDSRIPRQVEGCQIEILDGETVIFHPATQKILHCNESSTLIWGLCDGKHSVDEIVGILVSAYPGEAEAIRADVAETLDLFAEQGVLEWI